MFLLLLSLYLEDLLNNMRSFKKGVLDFCIWDLKDPRAFGKRKKPHLPSLMLKPLVSKGCNATHNIFYRQQLRSLSAVEFPLFLCCALLYVALSAN